MVLCHCRRGEEGQGFQDLLGSPLNGSEPAEVGLELLRRNAAEALNRDFPLNVDSQWKPLAQAAERELIYGVFGLISLIAISVHRDHGLRTPL